MTDDEFPFSDEVTTVEVPHALLALLLGKEIEDGPYRLWLDVDNFYNIKYKDDARPDDANWSCNFKQVCHLGTDEYRLTTPKSTTGNVGTGVTVENVHLQAPVIDAILLTLSRDWENNDPQDAEFDGFRLAGDKYRVSHPPDSADST